MKKIDVVIVSDAKNDFCKKITENAILSCKKDKLVGEVIVLEKQNITYDGAKTFRQEGLFSYNRFLNQGAAQGSSEYICFCNNDLLFEEDWARIIISAMEQEGVNSACPYSPISNAANKTDILVNSGIYYGYEIRKEFCGWCFVWKRSLWEKIKLDERIFFWASDNATAEQLKQHNEKHILVTDSIVHHVHNGSITLNTLPIQDKRILMHDEIKKFNRLYNQNFFGLGKDVEGKVTVVIPVFGNMDYWKPLLERASKSALKQTHKEINVVINVGRNLWEARNSFIPEIKTEYVIFLDADDELDENYISEMLKEEGDVIVPTVHRHFSNSLVDRSQFWYTPKSLLTGNFIVIGAMIKTELLRAVNGFNDLPLYEDWDMWLRMEEKGAKFIKSEKAIYKIHVREGSRNEPSDEMKNKMFNHIKNEALKRRKLT